jgi:hypothetical protein
MALQRPLKEGNVRTYQEKVGLGFTDILASEADADSDTMYAAWNGTLGGDLTGTLPNPTVAAAAKSKWTVSGATLTPTDATRTVAIPATTSASALVLGAGTVKTRLRDYGTGLGTFTVNRTDADGQDNAAQASWSLQLDGGGDRLDVFRKGPAGTWGNQLRLDPVSMVNTAPGAGASFGIMCIGSGLIGGAFTAKQSRGSTAAPTATLNGDILLQVSAYGYGTAYAEQDYFRMNATENWSGTARGCAVTFITTPNGTTSPSSYFTFAGNGDLSITGNTATKNTGTTWANPSDVRLKRDVAPYARGLADILQLEPISYTLTATDQQTCGLDAEKVRAVFPECVGTTRMKLQPEDEEETEVLTLDIHPILIALINAVKELAGRVSPVAQPA